MITCPTMFHSDAFTFPPLVAAWKHRFSSRCLAVVQEQAFGARTPSYKMIQELDKKVRNFYVPPSLRVPGFGGVKPDINSAQPSVELTMQRHVAFAIKEICTSSFFARISRGRRSYTITHLCS